MDITVKNKNSKF